MSFSSPSRPTVAAPAAESNTTKALEQVRLVPLMDLTLGSPEIAIGLIDGPVALVHPSLNGMAIREVSGHVSGACTRADSLACRHGTFVAGILTGKRGGAAPAICPGCTMLVRPIFPESLSESGGIPGTTPDGLAKAMVDTINAGARVLNVSAALVQSGGRGERALQEVIEETARRGVLVVTAAGNQGTIGSTVLTRHPWVIPVVACDGLGQPLPISNLGKCIGNRGLRACGDRIASLGSDGRSEIASGTSVAAPFVTGAIALLWSIFPASTARQINEALAAASDGRRRRLVPPLLDAWSAYQVLARRGASKT